MAVYIPSAKDITVSLDAVECAKPSKKDRLAIANKLVSLYENKSIVNLRRNLAVCTVCNQQCSFTVAGSSEEKKLAACSLIVKGDSSNLLIPVQMIHILLYHDEPIDKRLLALLED